MKQPQPISMARVNGFYRAHQIVNRADKIMQRCILKSRRLAGSGQHHGLDLLLPTLLQLSHVLMNFRGIRQKQRARRITGLQGMQSFIEAPDSVIHLGLVIRFA